MVFLIVLGCIALYVSAALSTTWTMSKYCLPLHPRNECGRIGCWVGFSSGSKQQQIEKCVRGRATICGVFWPVGLFIFGLQMSSQGGFNSYLRKEKELKAKAEMVEKLEAEEAEKQRKIDKIIAELRSKELSAEDQWMNDFYELGSK